MSAAKCLDSCIFASSTVMMNRLRSLEKTSMSALWMISPNLSLSTFIFSSDVVRMTMVSSSSLYGSQSANQVLKAVGVICLAIASSTFCHTVLSVSISSLPSEKNVPHHTRDAQLHAYYYNNSFVFCPEIRRICNRKVRVSPRPVFIEFDRGV